MLLLFASPPIGGGSPPPPPPPPPPVVTPTVLRSEVLLAYGNRAAAATLTGGSWVATMPITNLQDRQLSVRARSTDLALASTQFIGTMTGDQPCQCLAIANHSLSLTAQYRLRYGSDPTFATSDYDSGWKDVWPPVYKTSTLDWPDSNWWSGRYLEEERAGYTWTLVHILTSRARPTYWKWEFDDRQNTAGYIDLGRLFMASAWQPVNNMSYDATVGWETGTIVDEARSGAEFFDVKTPYRVAKFSTDGMTETEGMSKAFEIIRRSGIDKEVLFLWDPTDTIHALRRQFLGRLRTLTAIDYPYAFINGELETKTAWEVKELVP